jgi:hypothetical protein
LLSLLAPVFAALLGTACSSPSSTDGGNPPPPPSSGMPFPAGEGIKQSVSLSSLQTAGWSVCFDETYDTEGFTLGTVLDACAGRYMVLACSNAPDTLALAAGDLRKVVTQADVSANPLDWITEHHVSGTVGWYFNGDYSWGFFPAGAGVNRQSCDYDDGTQTQKSLRLCWRTSAGEMINGFRCGDNQLNFSWAWRRLILSYPAAEKEPNATIAQATPIDIGDRVVASISSATDEDFYSFAVPAGGADVLFQTFDASGTACDPSNLGVNPALDVYDATGAPVAHAADGLSGELCPALTVTLPEGTSYVAVTGLPPAPFTYTLKVAIP